MFTVSFQVLDVEGSRDITDGCIADLSYFRLRELNIFNTSISVKGLAAILQVKVTMTVTANVTVMGRLLVTTVTVTVTTTVIRTVTTTVAVITAGTMLKTVTVTVPEYSDHHGDNDKNW